MKRRYPPSSSARSPQPRQDSIAVARAIRPTDWLFIVALLAAVVLVYQPAWHGDVLWDDDMHITRPELQSWHGLYRIWFELGATLQYYPLLHTAFWIEYRLWGDATLGYHLVNVLLHTTAALMAALALRRLKIPGAYLAAAVFALHPIQVESVAWITEQKNTLSAAFYLGSLLAYLHFDRTRTTSRYLLALGLFVLGLLSKTVVATLPAALLVIFWWQRGRLSWRRDVLPLVPFFAIGATAGLFTAWVERKLIGAEGAAFDLTLVERCLMAGRVIWFYLGKLLWPGKLLFIYPRWQISQAAWWQYLFPLATFLLLAVLWALRRRWRGPLAGLLFFAGTLFPVLGFFNVFPFIYSFVADHFQYLAGLGIITLMSAGVALLLKRWALWDRPAAYGTCLVALAILAALTWQQSRMYADVEKLYRTTIAENPGCWMPYNNLGIVLADHGQLDEAMACYHKALELKPNDAYTHNNLGVSLGRKGRFDEAIVCYRKALEFMPNYSIAHINLGAVLARRGELDEAVLHLNRAVELSPDSREARQNLDLAIADRDIRAKAVAQLREQIRLQPENILALNKLASILATNPDASIRNGARAVELAQRAVKLTASPEPISLNILAAAYAEAGRFAEAVETAQQALALASSQNNTPLADAIRAQIKLYQNNSPYRALRPLSPTPSGRP
jgi:protein O-mannosyl-transferase